MSLNALRNRHSGQSPISAIIYPLPPDTWTGTTMQLISTSPDSSAIPEPPTGSSPLHRVSRNESKEARTKREARSGNPKHETRPRRGGNANPKQIQTTKLRRAGRKDSLTRGLLGGMIRRLWGHEQRVDGWRRNAYVGKPSGVRFHRRSESP